MAPCHLRTNFLFFPTLLPIITNYFLLYSLYYDVVSFCWLLLIKGREDEDQGWKYYNLLLPNIANIDLPFFKKATNPLYFYISK